MLETLRSAFMDSKDSYQLITRLYGHKGPISCLAFTYDGEVLASGGDDQTVRIWSVKGQKCRQTISDGNRWGQITCLKWLTSEAPAMTLCFGTGRGRMLIYRRGRTGKQLVESGNTQVFPESDSVETIAYDPVHLRLVASSHFGKIQAYTVEKGGTLIALWNSSMASMIPRAIHFVDNYQNIIICGLEKGEIVTREAVDGHYKSSRTLKSAIGSAEVCSNERYILVENLSTGFDLYHINRTSPARSLDIPTTKRYMKEGRFAENSTTVICGSDHGKVYIFEVATGERKQTLRHGDKGCLVQMIDTATSSDRHVIASGTSGSPNEICIWAKPTRQGWARKKDNHTQQDIINNLNGVVLLVMILWMVQAWGGQLVNVAEYTAISLYKTAAQHAAPKLVDSNWIKIIEGKELVEASREEMEEARIRARLERWYGQAVDTHETLSED